MALMSASSPRRNLAFLLGIIGAYFLFSAGAEVIPPLLRLTWPTVPARVISVGVGGRYLHTEVGKFGNVGVTGRVLIIRYEYVRGGRTFDVRDESHLSIPFGRLPGAGDTVRVRVDPDVVGISVWRPRPSLRGLLLLSVGAALLFATLRLARRPVPSRTS